MKKFHIDHLATSLQKPVNWIVKNLDDDTLESRIKKYVALPKHKKCKLHFEKSGDCTVRVTIYDEPLNEAHVIVVDFIKHVVRLDTSLVANKSKDHASMHFYTNNEISFNRDILGKIVELTDLALNKKIEFFVVTNEEKSCISSENAV